MEQKEFSTDNLENKTQGYVLLHRTLLDAPYFKDAHYVQLWIYLILKANHKEVFFNGVKIPRGGLLTGRKKISDDTWINESKVERMLKFLESEQQIEQLGTGKGRVIVIKNWDKFQKVNSKVNNDDTMVQQRLNNGSTMLEHIQVMSNDNNESNDIKAIVNYLNSVLGTNFKYSSKQTRSLIKARIKDGFTVDDFKLVIDKKFNEWDRTDMSKFLRPETLFSNKFEGYVNQQINKTLTKGEKNARVSDDIIRSISQDNQVNGNFMLTI